MFKDKALAGGYLAINKNTLEEITYIKPDNITWQKSYNLSLNIHAIKKANPKANTTVLEHEIDVMVVALTGLSAAEIKIVEQS